MIIIKLLLAILPTILIGLYIYKKDTIEKESKKLLSKLFMGGCLAAVSTIAITLIIEPILPSLIEPSNYLELILHCFIIIALVEESCKFFYSYIISWKNKEFNFSYDAIVYCVFVALGFATIENILFVLQGNLITALTRAISAVPGHACDAIFMGTYFGLAKLAEVNGNIKDKKKYLLLSIIVPTINHGIYDFFILTQNLFYFIIFIAFIIILYVLSIKKVNLISKTSHNLYGPTGYCPQCGTPIYNNGPIKYCNQCGTPICNNH